MTGRNKMWQKIDRKDFVQEHFWIGEFIQSDKWSDTKPPKFKGRTYPEANEQERYSYHKDGFEYNGKTYTFDNEIRVTEITHATKWENMCRIKEDRGFKSTEKYYPDIGVMNLVWFKLKIGEEEIDRVKESSKCAVHSLLHYEGKRKAESIVSESQFTHTLAFQPISRYGHFKFTLSIRDVLEAYKKQFGDGQIKPEMRKLGTFAYKQEIMHAILVCPPDTPDTDKCPKLNDDPIMKPDTKYETPKTWTWKPHSTGLKHVFIDDKESPYSSYIRWENVAFAFFVPKGVVMKIDNLENRLSFCLHLSEINEVSGFNQFISLMLECISNLKDKKISYVNMLISMIAGYLNEEPLYKKTMNKHSYGQYEHVDFEPVVQCLVKCLNPSELKVVNWSPLTKWMDSVTTHSNVLHAIHKYDISF